MLLESPAVVLIPPERPEQRPPDREVWSVIIQECAPVETDHTRTGAHAVAFQADRDDAAVSKIGRNVRG